MLSAEGYYGIPLGGHPLARLKVRASGPQARADMLSQWIAGLAFQDGSSVEVSVNDMAQVVEGIVNTFGPLVSTPAP